MPNYDFNLAIIEREIDRRAAQADAAESQVERIVNDEVEFDDCIIDALSFIEEDQRNAIARAYSAGDSEAIGVIVAKAIASEVSDRAYDAAIEQESSDAERMSCRKCRGDGRHCEC